MTGKINYYGFKIHSFKGRMKFFFVAAVENLSLSLYGNKMNRKFIETKVTAMKLQGFNL